MRRFGYTAIFAIAALTGCSSMNQGLSGSRQLTESEVGSVSGIIGLPEGVAVASCDDLVIRASSAQGVEGKSVVRQSRNRCSYELSRLPAGTPLTVSVQVPQSWQCKDGKPAVTTPANEPITLQGLESRVLDFRTACAS